jgi:hypothetical protein
MVRSGNAILAFRGDGEETRSSMVPTGPPDAQISGGALAANNGTETNQAQTRFRTAETSIVSQLELLKIGALLPENTGPRVGSKLLRTPRTIAFTRVGK